MAKAYKIYGHRAQRVKLRKSRVAAQEQAAREQWRYFQEYSDELGGCNGVLYVSSGETEEISAALDTFFVHLTNPSQTQQQMDTQASFETDT